MDKQVREIFQEKGLLVDRFILRNITFSPEYATSIEAKQVALQETIQREHEAEQARQVARGQADALLINVKAEAEAIRQRGAGDADAMKSVAAILQGSPDLLTYRYIEKLGPGVRVMLVPNNNPFILPLPSLEGDAAAATPLSDTLRITTTLPITATAPVTVTATPTP